MAEIVVWQNQKKQIIRAEAGANLGDVLSDHGYAVAKPCGGRGFCGKCAVEVTGAVSQPNDVELKAGVRLACQTVILGDCQVKLADVSLMQQIETADAQETVLPLTGSGIGAAVDIGTTTLALQLYDRATGKLLSTATAGNPQVTVAADVMGRIDAARNGRGALLRSQIETALHDLLEKACGEAGLEASMVDSFVIAGNTTMLYLLTGRNPDCLAHAPFKADTLFDVDYEILGRKAYLPSCMNAFVGADITCAVLSSQMTENQGPSLLCDIGTNGEIALWKDGILYVTSTAAGPAFEGAGISCGCGSVRGAIDKVWLEGDSLCVHTIGDAPAVGLCGSGLIDTVAAFLIREDVSETGAMSEKELTIAGNVKLTRKDIRAVQLAKAAIAAGIQTLLETTNTTEAEITDFYICGGFGTHLNLSSAVTIGLIPDTLAKRAKVLGNGALSGAVKMMLDCGCHGQAEELAASAKQMNLGGNPQFNENYIDQMLFPERE